jgi:hypothetical protein
MAAVTARSWAEAHKLAMSAGLDAGNRHAARNRRSAWDEPDWNEASRVMRNAMAAFGFPMPEGEGSS